MRQPYRWLPALRAVSLLMASVVVPLEAQAPRDCTTLGQTVFVRDTLQDIYFWYKELPASDPALFASPEAFLEAVRYRPRDVTFSYIAGKAESNAFYSDSQFIGLGFASKLVAADELRLTQVFPDSPAAEAGLRRGERIVEIGGRTIGELSANGLLGGAFGPSDVGVSVELRVRGLDGSERKATLVKRAVTIPTVSQTAVFEADGRLVGYLHFRNFVRPSTAALDAAFRDFSLAGVRELVLDLRYNGGGLTSVAQHLASLIGGVRTKGQVFVEYVHNDKNAFRNEEQRFDDPVFALDLERVVVITTRASASASELVINALRPFVKVVTVGESSYGKPVGQYGFDFCDKTLFPVAFATRNARGEGDYFDGIPADCPARDDLDHALGDAQEAALAEALHVVRAGTCSGSSQTLRATSAQRAAPARVRTGLRQLIGAD
jgi:C-terminal processing protease CtpA/Prc